MTARKKKAPKASGPAWPATAIEMRKLSELKERKGNPRRHDLDQIEQLTRSMRKFGWTMPLLVDEQGEVIAGHGRRRAGMLLGYEEGPVIVARGWTDEMKRAYCLADNKLALNSEWDQKLLRAELKTLVAGDFDMELIGFTDDELGALIIDPNSLKSADNDAEEVKMTKCPACGRYSQKHR